MGFGSLSPMSITVSDISRTWIRESEYFLAKRLLKLLSLVHNSNLVLTTHVP